MFNFGRRINRTTFLCGVILAIIGLIFIDLVQALIEGANEDFFGNSGWGSVLQGAAILLGSVLYFLYTLAITRQRANDVGWHPLLLTVLVFWNPLLLILLMLPGQKAQNRFGLVPKPGLTLR